MKQINSLSCNRRGLLIGRTRESYDNYFIFLTNNVIYLGGSKI